MDAYPHRHPSTLIRILPLLSLGTHILYKLIS